MVLTVIQTTSAYCLYAVLALTSILLLLFLHFMEVELLSYSIILIIYSCLHYQPMHLFDLWIFLVGSSMF